MLNIKKFLIAFTIVFLFSAVGVYAQSSAFVYQGKLQDGAAAANGTYQFEFKLFDAASGGNQIGQTLSDVSATVTNGIFSVNLDFGVASYTGAGRYLEISVRAAGSGQPYTNLNPRQEVTSTPYAVRSLNSNQADQSNTANFATDAANLGGIAANQYVLTTDPRLNQTPGNFIQNSTNQQPTSNFNISGEGKADKFTAATQFNIGANRVLTAGNGSLFVGFGAGQGGAIGGLNTFLGNNAGMNTTNGTRNTFTGAGAGLNNTLGNDNSFFGSGAGLNNTNAINNSFFGSYSGTTNTTGSNNSFFGYESGRMNTIGLGNAFFGKSSGKSNTTGGGNSFFGNQSGEDNTVGNSNAFFGEKSGQNNIDGSSNSFFGVNSGAFNTNGASNSFFGRNSGFSNTSGGFNTFFGINSGDTNTMGTNNTIIGANADVSVGGLQFATAIGAGAVVDGSNKVVLGRTTDEVKIPGTLYVSQSILTDEISANDVMVNGNLGVALFSGGGATPVCATLNGLYMFRQCSSSIRYKNNVQNFTRGLELINRLRPVTFDWKETGQNDIGFVAEEIADAEPLLATYNQTGQVEGVKYAQITTALVNAVKEQQTEIEKLEEQIKRQNEQIELLKALVCASNPNAAVCQQK